MNTLKDALTASLDELKNGSPINEADPYSIDEQFDRINNKLAAGMPETITEADLLPVVNRLRAQRHHFSQETEKRAEARRKGGTKKTRTTPAKSIAEALTLDMDEI